MVEVALAIALGLLFAGVIASVVPLVPGALLSLIGIYTYWVMSGYTEPGLLFLAVSTMVGLLALGLDYLSGIVSARASGAGIRTALAAGGIGVVALFIGGPVGALLGVVLTVFLLEFNRSRDVRGSLRTALLTTVGMVASSAMQVLLTVSLLVAFVVVVM